MKARHDELNHEIITMLYEPAILSLLLKLESEMCLKLFGVLKLKATKSKQNREWIVRIQAIVVC